MSVGSGPSPYQPARFGREETDGFAIAAFVCGLLGLSLFGLVFGIVGLRRTSGRRRGGRGFAIAGIVLSIVWILVAAAIVALVLVTTSHAKAEADNAVKSVGLSVGECLNPARLTWVTAADVVPCSQPHNLQIMQLADSSGDDCEASIGQLSNSYSDVNYWYQNVRDTFNGVYWCGVGAGLTGIDSGKWTGSWFDQDVQTYP